MRRVQNQGRTLPRTLLVGLVATTAVDARAATGNTGAAQAALGSTGAWRALVVPTHPAAPAARPQGAEPCFPVRELHIRGVSLIDQNALRRRLDPLALSCINTASATAIVQAINEAHADKGYITTQGYLPAQDIRKTGLLEIDVATGRIGAITYTEKTDKDDAGYWTRLGKAFDAMHNPAGLWGFANGVSDLGHALVSPLGQPRLLNGDAHRGFRLWSASGMTPRDVLHVDAVQRGVDAINSVSSSRAEAKLTPGKEPGTSDIAITNMPYRPLRLSGGYELNGKSLNQQGETSGSRLRVDLARDNLIGVNDMWSAALASGENSNEARGGVSIPLRRLTLSAFAGYSEQLTAATATTAYFFQTTTTSGAASYVLAQDRNSKTSLDAALSWRQLRRSVNSFRLTPQTIAPVRIGLSRIHMWQTDPESWLTGTQLSYGIGVSRGLTIWRATRDGWRPGQDAPRAQFRKLDGAFGVAQGIRDIGVIRLDVTGQWTRHPLYADDQLSLGSIDTVRGFTGNLVRVDRGVVARAEFAPALSLARMFARPDDKMALPFMHDMLTALQPYGFADLGHGRDIANRSDITRVGARRRRQLHIGAPQLQCVGRAPHAGTRNAKGQARPGNQFLPLFQSVVTMVATMSFVRSRAIFSGLRVVISFSAPSVPAFAAAPASKPEAKAVAEKVNGAEALKAGLAALEANQFPEAVAKLNAAFSAGQADAGFYLGRMVELGVGLQRDVAKARVLYLSASGRGSAKAMNRIGLMHARGEGVLQDDKAAAEIICKAANLGDADAMFNCAGLLADGRGVAVDQAAALRWYDKAAGLGQIGALNAMGFASRDGLGLPKGATKALHYFGKAASKGNPVALFEVASMYEQGAPVPQDLEKAHLYYNLAAARQHPEASAALQRVTAALSADQIARAQAAAKTWKATRGTSGTLSGQPVIADRQEYAPIKKMPMHLAIRAYCKMHKGRLHNAQTQLWVTPFVKTDRIIPGDSASRGSTA